MLRPGRKLHHVPALVSNLAWSGLTRAPNVTTICVGPTAQLSRARRHGTRGVSGDTRAAVYVLSALFAAECRTMRAAGHVLRKGSHRVSS